MTTPLSRPGAEDGFSLEKAEAVLRLLGGNFAPAIASPPLGASSPPVSESFKSNSRAEAIRAGGAIDRFLLEKGGFQSFLEAVPDAVILVNQEGLIVQINAHAEQLFGYSRDELLGQAVELLVPERFRGNHVAQRAAYFAEPRVRPMGIHLDLSGRRKDGREVPVEISLSPLRVGGETFVVSTLRDISERRRAKEQLDKLEKRYRTLVEGIPAVTFMASLDEDASERELYVSPQIETLLGFSQKEWLEDPLLWYTQLHPDDRYRWHEEFARTIATGEPFRSVYRFVARDGRVVWVHGEARVVRDDDGRPLFLQGVAFDITTIKQAEQELEQRVKERTQELAQSKAKLEVFAYTASHDLKEPLRAIGIYTQRLQGALDSWKKNVSLFQHDMKDSLSATAHVTQKLQELLQGQEDEIREHLKFIIENTRYMDGLLRDLDDYAHVGQEGRAATVDCTRVFEAACGILQEAIADSGATVTAEPLPAVRGVETELVRLFQNLINNALKYRKPDQLVQIHVGCRRREDYWEFGVRDNGIGIRERFLDGRIFGIGQKSRLHPRGKIPGTGFGLAICKQIVESHGGSIWVESVFGQGSTFYFTLPAAPPA
ncbi:MAG TPA: PAS domain S-box protein [Gemmataceae bacterium]|nr:PAS domain S-box protein [Gemmataceae bacterium]